MVHDLAVGDSEEHVGTSGDSDGNGSSSSTFDDRLMGFGACLALLSNSPIKTAFLGRCTYARPQHRKHGLIAFRYHRALDRRVKTEGRYATPTKLRLRRYKFRTAKTKAYSSEQASTDASIPQSTPRRRACVCCQSIISPRLIA